MVFENLNALIEHGLIVVAVLVIAVLCSVHAIIYKRESNSALAWLGLIFLSPLMFSFMFVMWDWRGVLVIAPLIASMFYLFLGINKLTREFKQAAFRQQDQVFNEKIRASIQPLLLENNQWRAIAQTGLQLGYSEPHFCELDILHTGDEAYPEMLAAIDAAQKHITLFSYIFAFNETGKDFCDALIRAKGRGVQVRVLVDAVGSHKHLGQLANYLRLAGIPFAKFMPVLFKTQFSNLRNHRKLLVIDAKVAFTGGLNISDLYWPSRFGEGAAIDLHFKVQGRLVNYLQECFVNDWQFATGESLQSDEWFDENLPERGSSLGRVIVDGPSYEEERLHWHFLNAINTAKDTIRIVTPYFLPNAAITAALCSAALRGVNVEIIVPKKSDHIFMDWALRGNMFELMSRGCNFYLKEGAFDHSKFLVVDEAYASIGSANWDARSLRLNYELNIEVFEHEFVGKLDKLFALKRGQSESYSLDQWQSRNFAIKLRDGFARLFSPYL